MYIIELTDKQKHICDDFYQISPTEYRLELLYPEKCSLDCLTEEVASITQWAVGESKLEKECDPMSYFQDVKESYDRKSAYEKAIADILLCIDFAKERNERALIYRWPQKLGKHLCTEVAFDLTMKHKYTIKQVRTEDDWDDLHISW